MGELSQKPLVIALPGEFDFSDYSLTAAWEEQLPDVGVNVKVLDAYSIPDVVHKRSKSFDGVPRYDCDWSPKDYTDHIKATIDEFQPSETILLGFAFGAEEAKRNAVALKADGYSIAGIISLASTAFLGSGSIWGTRGGEYYYRSPSGSGVFAHNSRDLSLHPPNLYNLFRGSYVCTRYTNPLHPRRDEARRIRIPERMPVAYRWPFRGSVDDLEDFEGSAAELLKLSDYTFPTVFMVGKQDTYTPPSKVRSLLDATNKQAPTEFVLLDGVDHDIRANEAQVQRVVTATMDKIGQLVTTKTIAAPKALNAMLGMGQPATRDEANGVVVISTMRPIERQAPVIHAAAEADTPVVALVSHDLTPRSVVETMHQLGATGLVAEIPQGFRLGMTEGFASPAHPCVQERDSNLWTKRNIGLLAADEERGRDVIFSDDDILWAPTDLAWAKAVLRHAKVAGFLPKYFRDKSVVYHADYLAGGDRELEGVSISGNSLAVSAKAATESFFDRGYNEDRTFIHPFVAEGSAVRLGDIRQLEYDPFSDPTRAASEVFGDVLADGLFYLQGIGMSFREVGEDFWRYTMIRYSLFVDDIAERLTARLERGDGDVSIPQALASLHAAKLKLETYSERDFSSYVRDWDSDMMRWSERYAKLPKGMSVAESLAFHGLSAQIVGRPSRYAVY